LVKAMASDADVQGAVAYRSLIDGRVRHLISALNV
jgi:hypothetical protein